ncbi:MAG: hypothetical protein JW774_01465 [Candidatus Aureabacteria bacterium]|nr:hypothetical protein [Candidatus Auribacterota bacterium]
MKEVKWILKGMLSLFVFGMITLSGYSGCGVSSASKAIMGKAASAKDQAAEKVDAEAEDVSEEVTGSSEEGEESSESSEDTGEQDIEKD